jgi:hypothetical protein
MANGVQVGFTFQTQSGPIPLSELDSNFSSLQSAINSMNSFTNYLVDTSGAANVITVSLPTGQTGTYVAGLGLQIAVANTTTITNPTINLNSLGTRTVLNADGSALAAGQIVAGQYIDVLFDGTSFRLMSQGGASSVTSFKQLTVGPPASGNALTVVGKTYLTGQAGGNIQILPVGAGAVSQSAFQYFTDNNLYIDAPNTGTPAGAQTIFRQDGATASLSIANTRGVTIAAPTSGVSLQVGGIAGQTYLNVGTTSDTIPVAQLIGAGVSRNALVLNANGVQATEFVQNFSGSTDSFGVPTNSYGIMGLTGTGNLIFGTNSLVRATISNGLQIGAPTGGDLGGGTINATGYYVNGVLLALPVRVIKTTLQSIASNVTPANDNTLVYAISATGTYAFKVVAYTYNTVSATVGIKCNVNYSGTFTAASSGEGIFSTGFSSFGAQVPAVVTAAIGFGNIGATAAGAATVVIDGSIVVTGAGTLGFAWSQNNTNATGTVVAAGSYLEVTKIA